MIMKWYPGNPEWLSSNLSVLENDMILQGMVKNYVFSDDYCSHFLTYNKQSLANSVLLGSWCSTLREH